MRPDEADFADEADKEITAETFAAKLGELEQELDDAGAGEPSSADAGGAAPPGSTAAAAKDRGADRPDTPNTPKGRSRRPVGTDQPGGAIRP
jgi:hypothetical protein